MSKIFSIDEEGVREVFRDLVDCLADIGFNVPQENFEERSGNMQKFLASLGNLDPDEAWQMIDGSLKKLAQDVGGDVQALKYLKVAHQDLLQAITYED